MRQFELQAMGHIESTHGGRNNSRLPRISSGLPVLAMVAIAVIYTNNYPGEITINVTSSSTVTEPAITVTGTVENKGIQTIELDVNGSTRTVSVDQGTFQSRVPLLPGENTIHASVAGALATLVSGSRVTRVIAQIPPSDIWTELDWEGLGDIDLHLYLPNGEHCFYGNKQTQVGASLDVDNQWRDGPEHITMGNAIPGEYRVTVLYYAAKNDAARKVPWRVTVRLKNGSVQTYSGVLRTVHEEQTVDTFRFP